MPNPDTESWSPQTLELFNNYKRGIRKSSSGHSNLGAQNECNLCPHRRHALRSSHRAPLAQASPRAWGERGVRARPRRAAKLLIYDELVRQAKLRKTVHGL